MLEDSVYFAAQHIQGELQNVETMEVTSAQTVHMKSSL
jgi:hypothetical protein